MRKLASIQRIMKLEPIEGRDRIELATILGWHVIVEKGLFKINDLCIYIEYDSILPEGRPEFEFLRSRCYSKKWNGFRIGCIKIAGVFSEGIVFPLLILKGGRNLKEDMNVTDLLEIRKYDPQIFIENKIKERKSKNPIIRFLMHFKIFKNILLKKHIKLCFPTHLVQKTDEIRIQTVPFLLEEYKGIECIITEKLDGCSATYLYNKKKFMVCSRNIEVVDKNNVYWKIMNKYNLKKILKDTNFAIQGEIIGQGVSNGSGKNIYELKDIDFYVFNIVDTKNRKRLDWGKTNMFCLENRLKIVPSLDIYYKIGNHNINELLELSKGDSLLFPTEREGIVIRERISTKRQIKDVGEYLSFKVINPDFLLKDE